MILHSVHEKNPKLVYDKLILCSCRRLATRFTSSVTLFIHKVYGNFHKSRVLIAKNVFFFSFSENNFASVDCFLLITSLLFVACALKFQEFRDIPQACRRHAKEIDTRHRKIERERETRRDRQLINMMCEAGQNNRNYVSPITTFYARSRDKKSSLV